MQFDPLTGEPALLAPDRGGRPNDFDETAPAGSCAFCPGNENETPPEVERNGTPWTTRAFPNKFPAVSPPGVHEVIVDGPAHAAAVTPESFLLWRRRYETAVASNPKLFPVLFKNSGEAGGATIAHPHTQLIATEVVPPRFAAIREHVRRYRERLGRCILCDEMDAAEIVGEDGAAVAFVRSGNKFARALTIAVRECVPSLHRSSEPAWRDCGHLLERALASLQGDAGIPGFNVLTMSDAGSAEGHWYFDVLPRTSALAGYELASGVFVKSVAPKESAAWWRRMIRDLHGRI